MEKGKKLKIIHLLTMSIIGIFLIGALLNIFLVVRELHTQAMKEAESKARILLDRNLAVHAYFNKVLKPKLFEWSAPFRTREYFDPTWMSSSYAIREIQKYTDSYDHSGYSIKDATINARNPADEADDYERDFLEKLKTDKTIESRSSVRVIDGKPYLSVLRRGEVIEQSCLECHGNPSDAPQGLLQFYGAKRSFHRQVGDVVSAISIRIPLASAYEGIYKTQIQLSLFLAIGLAALLTSQFLLYRHFLVSPVKAIRDKALEIAGSEERLGEKIREFSSRELNELSGAFNEMSNKLRISRDQQEDRINERTNELRLKNEQLAKEIDERTRVEKENAIIAEIGRVVGSTLNIEEVYDRVATEVRKAIPYDRFRVTLKASDNALVVAYVSGIEILGRKVGDLLPADGTSTGAAIKRSGGVLVQPASPEEVRDLYPIFYDSYNKTGLRSMLTVPLITMNEVIGSLVFRSKMVNAYTDRDIRLAERIALQIVGAIANAHLYTDLKEAARRLRESEERFRTLVEKAPDAIFVQTSKKFAYVNKAALRLFGADSEDQLLGQSVIDRFHPDSRELGEERIRLLNEGKMDLAVSERKRLKLDGTAIDVEVSAVPVTYNDQEGAIVFVRDITERKQAEKERQALQERLQRSEKMEAVGKLAGGVAHDLNNVLGVSSAYAELLQENIAKDSLLRKYADNIFTSSQKAAAIIEDLLTLARRSVVVSEVINLNSVVSGFLKNPVFEKVRGFNAQVSFRTEFDNDLLNITGSPVHLEKTVMNLVTNAAEAISGRGEVTIRTENRYLTEPIGDCDEFTEGDYAALIVSDTGKGIPAEHLGNIFEPFYTKKTMGRSGTGLGLAIVWGTVRDHHAYIDVQSEIGKGATFTLFFPATREDIVKDVAKIPIEQYMGQGEAVLVVDDVAEQRQLATVMLTRLGYQVHAVSSGEEAVEYLKDNRADILVLDMIMDPGIDGLETYKRICEINPQQKAVIASGFSETEQVKEAQSMGAGAYVKKPYIMEKVGVAIRQELDRG